MIKLVVTHAFAGYQVGAEITDAATIASVRATHPHNVVPVGVDDAPSPAPEPQQPEE